MVSVTAPTAGRLQLFYREWLRVTTNPIVLDWVRGYKIPFLTQPTQSKLLMPQVFSQRETQQISTEIKHLLHIGAVNRCNPLPDQFISRIFLTDKRGGKKRFIINLKKLNIHVNAPHFKMEDARTAMRLIQQGCYGATIDLKEAYYILPIHADHRKFLRFFFEGEIYEFTCLPFGLASAPYTFTKLMKPIVQNLRKQGISCVNYLDDFLLLGQSKEECSRNLTIATQLIETLGFVVNLEKSAFFPHRKFKFLGFMFDSIHMTLELPTEKRKRILEWIEYFQSHTYCKIKKLAQFLGILTSSCPAVKYGWVYTKRLERAKYLALQTSFDNYDANMSITPDVLTDLKWWEENVNHAFNNLKNDKFDLEIYTDASLSGWGSFCSGETSNGWWTLSERGNHINFLELQAIFYGLQCFASHLEDATILIRTDNTTALSYINRMGSVRFPKLNQLARVIWQWAEKRRLGLFASYISSNENSEADQASRIFPSDTEWSLNHDIFDHITSIFGTPEIDLFASFVTHKCARYFAWQKDPGAEAVDAFTVNWADCFFYAFPPFSLILRALQKVCDDKATGIFVIPLWQGQPWYPLFLNLTVGRPLYFPPSTDLLFSPYSENNHPLSANLTLVVAKLSGKASNDKEFHHRP